MTPMPASLPGWKAASRAAWQSRSERERRLLAAAVLILALSMTWAWMLAPALLIWREAPARQAALDARTEQMMQWRAEVRRLHSPSQISRDEAMRELQTLTSDLLGPSSSVRLQGDHVLLTLAATSADGLVQWLPLARDRALALPVQARLQRDEATLAWSGTLLLRLP